MKKSLVKIKAHNAAGTILAHDITRIVPGKFKGVGFKKGHVIREEDIPELLKIGKQHIYVLNSDKIRSMKTMSPCELQRPFAGITSNGASPARASQIL